MNIDEEKAKDMIGKYVLVGVNRLDAKEEIINTEQIHGEVLRISEDDGLTILQPNGSEFSLPPILACYQEAEKGIYTLKSTNEKITDPDYVATFNVSATEDGE